MIYTRQGHNLTFLPGVTQLKSARREYKPARFTFSI
jgi:hypothetical protein